MATRTGIPCVGYPVADMNLFYVCLLVCLDVNMNIIYTLMVLKVTYFSIISLLVLCLLNKFYLYRIMDRSRNPNIEAQTNLENEKF